MKTIKCLIGICVTNTPASLASVCWRRRTDSDKLPIVAHTKWHSWSNKRWIAFCNPVHWCVSWELLKKPEGARGSWCPPDSPQSVSTCHPRCECLSVPLPSVSKSGPSMVCASSSQGKLVSSTLYTEFHLFSPKHELMPCVVLRSCFCGSHGFPVE